MKKDNDEVIRVVHIIGKWLGGGVESVVMNYYRNIDRTKIQFDFICDSDSTNIPYDEIELLGGKVIIVPPYQKIFKYNKELKKIFKENNYKIVHSHINTLSVFPLRIAKMCKVPIRIAHSHSTTNKKEWKKNFLKQMLRPFSKVYANRYMCCTEHAGRWLFGEKSFDRKEVYILNNAIDINKFKYDEKQRNIKRKELGIKANEIVIGHLGRFVAQKNHAFLIDIFNEIFKIDNNAVLILAGQGPLQKEIIEKVNALELSKKVKFLGQVNDVEKLYQAIDIFLFPSLYEGLGMVLIEAQCAGVPCITSTRVPNIAKVSDAIEFVRLEESAELWAKIVIDMYKSINRSNHVKKISDLGYDIGREVINLEKKYFSFISSINEEE